MRRTAAACARAILVLTAVLALTGGPALAQKEITEKQTKATKSFVAELEKLAEWADKQKLFRERNRTDELILVLDPENAPARKALGFEKKNGAWTKSANPKESGNLATDGMKEFGERRQKANDAFLGAMDQLLKDERGMIDGDLKNRIASDMAAVDREDPRARAAGGETNVANKWVLSETANAVIRRGLVTKLAKAALAAVPAAGGLTPEEVESSLGIGWPSRAATKSARCLCTGDAKEAPRIAHACEAAAEFFAKLFDEKVVLPDSFTIYALTDTLARDTLLAKYPGIPAAERTAGKGLGGFTLPGGSRFACWGPQPPERLDQSVRRAFGVLLERAFGIGSQQGALHEGLGLYLTYQLIGTKLTWYIGPRKYAVSGKDVLQDKLHKNETDWMAEAKALLAKPDHPPLKAMLAHDLNDLTPEEMLYSYLLAAYFIEGSPDDSPRFIRALCRPTPSDKAAYDAYGVNVDGLEARIKRWARELK